MFSRRGGWSTSRLRDAARSAAPKQFSSSIAVNADDSHEAAALGSFFAVAEEKIAAAGGTEIAHGDVLGAETSIEELRAVGFAEIEENVFRPRLVARRRHAEPL